MRLRIFALMFALLGAIIGGCLGWFVNIALQGIGFVLVAASAPYLARLQQSSLAATHGVVGMGLDGMAFASITDGILSATAHTYLTMPHTIESPSLRWLVESAGLGATVGVVAGLFVWGIVRMLSPYRYRDHALAGDSSQ